MRLNDWSSHVCTSDLSVIAEHVRMAAHQLVGDRRRHLGEGEVAGLLGHAGVEHHLQQQVAQLVPQRRHVVLLDGVGNLVGLLDGVGRDGREVLFQRSEEHTSELQSLMRISYAVFCFQKKNNNRTIWTQEKEYRT